MIRNSSSPTHEEEVELELEKGKGHPSRRCQHRYPLKLVLVLAMALSVVGWLTTCMSKTPLTMTAIKTLDAAARNQLLRPTEPAQNSTQSITDDPAKITSQPIQHSSRQRFAYFFYATSNIYACAALQLIDRLTNKHHMNSSRIDVVVMHTRRVGLNFLQRMQDRLHVKTILVEPIYADAAERTWRESLTKLRAFQDWGYDRVVFLDSDAVLMTNLDHLFDLPPAPLYAPTAYWLQQPFFASTVLVIEPSNAVFDGIVQWARERGAAAGFDMDILNAYFADSVHHLPGVYTVLNSDFRRTPTAKSTLFDTTAELKENTKVVHFSCKPDGSYGKPWDWPSHNLNMLAGEGFDPLFSALFEGYWRGERELCSTS